MAPARRATRPRPGLGVGGLARITYNEFDVPIQIKGWINVIPYEGTHYEVPRGHAGTRIVVYRNLLRGTLSDLAQAQEYQDISGQIIKRVITLVCMVERSLLVGSLLLVLIVELLNSAIEAAVDRISFENHRLAKRAKDIGSAAVMLSLVNAAVIWLIVIVS